MTPYRCPAGQSLDSSALLLPTPPWQRQARIAHFGSGIDDTNKSIDDIDDNIDDNITVVDQKSGWKTLIIAP